MSRDPLDRYMTPQAVADACCAWLDLPRSWSVLEPSAGNGAWVEGLRRAGHTGPITAVDVWDEARALTRPDVDAVRGDYLDSNLALPSRPVDVVLGNPPFGLAVEFLRRSLEVAPRVAFLLRGTFIELTRSRVDLWNEVRPIAEWTLGDRIKFLDADDKPFKKTDSVCHSLLFFDRRGSRGAWPREVWRVSDPTWVQPVSVWGRSVVLP